MLSLDSGCTSNSTMEPKDKDTRAYRVVPLGDSDDNAQILETIDGHVIRGARIHGRVARMLNYEGSEKAKKGLLDVMEDSASEDYWEADYRVRRDHDEPPRVAVPTVEHFARALHLCDPDVLVFACEVGEASARPDSEKLKERGPAVIKAVEKMWERDEFGLRSKWIGVATRALDILKRP